GHSCGSCIVDRRAVAGGQNACISAIKQQLQCRTPPLRVRQPVCCSELCEQFAGPVLMRCNHAAHGMLGIGKFCRCIDECASSKPRSRVGFCEPFEQGEYSTARVGCEPGELLSDCLFAIVTSAIEYGGDQAVFRAELCIQSWLRNSRLLGH